MSNLEIQQGKALDALIQDEQVRINPLFTYHIKQLRSIRDYYEKYNTTNNFKKCSVDGIFAGLNTTVDSISELIGEEVKLNLYGEEACNE